MLVNSTKTVELNHIFCAILAKLYQDLSISTKRSHVNELCQLRQNFTTKTKIRQFGNNDSIWT